MRDGLAERITVIFISSVLPCLLFLQPLCAVIAGRVMRNSKSIVDHVTQTLQALRVLRVVIPASWYHIITTETMTMEHSQRDFGRILANLMAAVGYHIVILLFPMLLLKIEKHRTREEYVLDTSVKPYRPTDVAMIGHGLWPDLRYEPTLRGEREVLP